MILFNKQGALLFFAMYNNNVYDNKNWVSSYKNTVNEM